QGVGRQRVAVPIRPRRTVRVVPPFCGRRLSASRLLEYEGDANEQQQAPEVRRHGQPLPERRKRMTSRELLTQNTEHPQHGPAKCSCPRSPFELPFPHCSGGGHGLPLCWRLLEVRPESGPLFSPRMSREHWWQRGILARMPPRRDVKAHSAQPCLQRVCVPRSPAWQPSGDGGPAPKTTAATAKDKCPAPYGSRAFH